MADYVVTEAGFGADLVRKIFEHQMSESRTFVSCAVVVATVRALKLHGDVDLKTWRRNLKAVEDGLPNLTPFGEFIKIWITNCCCFE